MDELQLDPVFDNYCVMGNPIAHSKSPDIHHAFALQTREKIHYQSILVPVGEFPKLVKQFQQKGGKGINVTVPYKEEAWDFVNTRTERAEQAGAVNTIWFDESGNSFGDTTDGTGLINDLINHDISIENKKILILGAGGAVRGVIANLVELQPTSILIANRTQRNAEKLIDRFPAYSQLDICGFAGLSDKGNFDLIINSIPAGLTADLPPLPKNIVADAGCCYDMVYGESDTLFI